MSVVKLKEEKNEVKRTCLQVATQIWLCFFNSYWNMSSLRLITDIIYITISSTRLSDWIYAKASC